MSCLIKDCKKRVHSRGICRDHYQIASITVRVGETTWEELERLGMVGPATRIPRGKKRVAFDEQLASLRKKR